MLQAIIDTVMASQPVVDKVNIGMTHTAIGNEAYCPDPFQAAGHTIAIGDDCAAIPDGHGGYLLFAAEGMIPSFVESAPWFAGYSAVMVNINDVCAMGGLPLAVTDVLWLKDHADGREVWAGMQAASKAYGVPIVGGHTCYRSGQKHVAVAVLGRASRLLTSYDARPGETLMMAVDMDGCYYGHYPFWDASTKAPQAHLQSITRLMNCLAEQGLSAAAKDISMGGIAGTLAMLMRTSKVGAAIRLEDIPKPATASWEKWLVSFPSFGFLFTCTPERQAAVQAIFAQADINCAAIGTITPGHKMVISCNDEKVTVELN